MAEKATEGTDTSSLQNLKCPLCLDIFDEATILTSCKHIFCRKCLKKYDLSHQDLDHMVCPLCRTIIKFTANRVDDLPADTSTNELVDDYHGNCGGVIAVLEMRPKCTACKDQGEAVSFCRTCNNYMCEECLQCHQRLTSLFEGHEIVSIEDVIEGNVEISQNAEKCSSHQQEMKDMFCNDCKVHVCHKCVIIGHRFHGIKSGEDFERDMQAKVNDLVQRCGDKKSELEKNIQNAELQRQQVHTAVRKLQDDVDQAYSIKAKQLEDNKRKLKEQIDALKQSFDADLDALKSVDRQRIKSMCSTMTLVANDRLGRLETDTLSAHIMLCEELDAILKEVTDHTSASAITKKAQKKRFHPADPTWLDLGTIISEIDPQSKSDKKVEEVTDDTSELAMQQKQQTQRFLSADHTCLDIRNISDPKLQVVRCVDLRNSMNGMTKYSRDSVAIGYGYSVRGIDIIHSEGSKQPYTNIPSCIECYDLVFQQDRSVCISTGRREAHVYSPNGSRKSTIHMTDNDYVLRPSISPTDEIIMAYGAEEVRIYDPTGYTLKHIIPTKHIARHASATRSGLIITSSCCSNPSVVTVFDRDGNAGNPLRSPRDGVYRYAAVDEQDRVYVASVDWRTGKVMITLYDIDGLNLKEIAQFNELNLTLGWNSCYLVSLSPDLLAFANENKLYFIKLHV